MVPKDMNRRQFLKVSATTAAVAGGGIEGILAAPEGGAGLAVIQQLVARGQIARGESVVLFNTGSGHKYLEAWQTALAG